MSSLTMEAGATEVARPSVEIKCDKAQLRELMALGVEAGCPPAALVVLVGLWAHTDDGGNARPSQDQLTLLTGLCRRSIQTATRKIPDDLLKRYRPPKSGTVGRALRYVVAMPARRVLRPLPRRAGVASSPEVPDYFDPRQAVLPLQPEARAAEAGAEGGTRTGANDGAQLATRLPPEDPKENEARGGSKPTPGAGTVTTPAPTPARVDARARTRAPEQGPRVRSPESTQRPKQSTKPKAKHGKKGDGKKGPAIRQKIQGRQAAPLVIRYAGAGYVAQLPAERPGPEVSLGPSSEVPVSALERLAGLDALEHFARLAGYREFFEGKPRSSDEPRCYEPMRRNWGRLLAEFGLPPEDGATVPAEGGAS